MGRGTGNSLGKIAPPKNISAFCKSPDCPTPEHKEVAPVEAGAEGKMTFTVGIIIEERPLWQRILWPWGG